MNDCFFGSNSVRRNACKGHDPRSWIYVPQAPARRLPAERSNPRSDQDLIVVHTRMHDEATNIIVIARPVVERAQSFKRFLRHR